MQIKAIGREISRRSFLKPGLAGIPAIGLLLIAGCVGADDYDDDDGGRRRRRCRR